jgi:hypothetical protein
VSVSDHEDTTTPWIKARCSADTSECVEMRSRSGAVEVRDTKDRGIGPSLTIGRTEFAVWLHGAKSGALDRLI